MVNAKKYPQNIIDPPAYCKALSYESYGLSQMYATITRRYE